MPPTKTTGRRPSKSPTRIAFIIAFTTDPRLGRPNSSASTLMSLNQWCRCRWQLVGWRQEAFTERKALPHCPFQSLVFDLALGKGGYKARCSVSFI